MFYGLVNANNDILRLEDNIDPNVMTKSGFKWLPVFDKARPSYNPKTHFAEQIITITDEDITRDWLIRAKTVEEVFNEKMEKINNIDPIIFNCLFDIHNNIRSLKFLEPITVDNFKLTMMQFYTDV